MEWLLIVLTSLAPQQEKIVDMRFSTKAECMEMGDDILARRVIPRYRKTEEQTEKEIKNLNPLKPFLWTEIQCVKAPKK